MKLPKLAYSQHQSLRMSRSSYKGDVNGIPIRAIDMPGLHARDHSEDTPAEIVATLIHLTNRKADILIYCSPLNQRIDKIDEKIIRTLNKVFSEVIWKNAIVAFTHADYVLEKQKTDYDGLLSEFRKEFQATLRHFGVLACVISANDEAGVNSRNDPAIISTPLETSVDPEYRFMIVGVPTGENPNKPPKWRQELLSQIININLKNTGSIILQLNGIRWKEVADLMKEKTLKASIKASAHKYGGGIGGGIGIALGSFLGVAVANKALPTAPPITVASLGGALGGHCIGSIWGHGFAALYILARGINHPQNKACAGDIAFYVKVNKKLKELKDGLQE